MGKNDIINPIYATYYRRSRTIYCIYETLNNFFEFEIKVSSEYMQDLNGIYREIQKEAISELISEHSNNSKKISLERISIIKDHLPDRVNKILIPYIRKEKLNKLNI